MNLPVILLLIAAALLLFWIAPGILSTVLIFCGRQRPEVAMGKTYFLPFREEMDGCIAYLERLSPARVGVTAGDGVALSALWFDRGGDKTVLMAHGYKASALSNFCISGKVFWERGYNLLLIDQRAHGRSGGRCSTFGLHEQYDLLRWIDWIRQNTSTRHLAVYGVSMGCAAMAYASDKVSPERVQAMILDCGFTSPRDELVRVGREKHVPWQIMLPVIRACFRLFIGGDIYQPVSDSLRKTRIPAFFLHGGNDNTVTPEHCRENYAACASEKALELVPGAEHTMAFAAGGAPTRERLFAFLNRAFQERDNDFYIEERDNQP